MSLTQMMPVSPFELWLGLHRKFIIYVCGLTAYQGQRVMCSQQFADIEPRPFFSVFYIAAPHLSGVLEREMLYE